MNILFLTDIYPIGGSRTFLTSVSSAFQTNGHRLFLVGLANENESDLSTSEYCSVDIQYVKDVYKISLRERLTRLYPLLRKVLSTHDIDCILVDLVYPASTLLLLRPFLAQLLKGVKILYQFHGLDSLERAFADDQMTGISVRHLQLSLQKFLRFRFDQFVLNTVPNKIIVFSVYAQNLLKGARVTTPIEIIKPGIDVKIEKAVQGLTRHKAREALGLSQKENFVLIASRLEPRKGVLNFFRTLDATKENAKGIRFLIVSDFWNDFHTYQFFQVLAEKGLGSQVFCISKPSRKELAYFYRAADVTIVPSLDLETLGFVSLESMKLGTPVVAYDIGANAEMIEPQLLVQPVDQNKLLKKIQGVLKLNQSQRKTLQAKMVEKTKKYDWNSYVKRLTTGVEGGLH